MTPDVSVIIPVYNVEAFLDECLASVTGQSYENIEIICVDDGSTDGSNSILHRWRKNDHRITIIEQENRGVSVARNRGVSEAQGEYILFVDSDDAIDPRTVEYTYSLAKKEKADVVNFHYREDAYLDKPNPMPALNKVSYKVTNSPLHYCYNRGEWSIPVTVWSKLYRRDVLHNLWFVPRIKSEDYPYVIALFSRRMKSLIIHLPFYFYRKNSSLTMNLAFSIQRIDDYHKGMTYLMNWYGNVSSYEDKKYLARVIFPYLLRQILLSISGEPENSQVELLNRFTEMLRDIKKRGYFGWRGHAFKHYWTYRQLLKGKCIKVHF